MDVLITVPHAKCLLWHPKKWHSCDYDAQLFAEMLFSKLSKIHRAQLFIGDLNRLETVDLNRLESRLTTFREKIRSKLFKLITNNISTEIYLFDVHSYPLDSENFKTIKVPNPDVVIIYNHLKNKDKAEIFKSSFIKSGFKVNLFLSHGNDIIDESTTIEKEYKLDIRIIPLLIEILEGMSQEKKKKLIKVISNLL